MKWWLDFLQQWPGKSLTLESHWTPNASMKLFTDASGKDGWELIGQDDGPLTIGLQYKAKQVLPGRSSMLLPLPLLLTHGVLPGTVEKS